MTPELAFLERARPQFVQDARRSMLRRLASDISVLARTQEMAWTCCWQDFDRAERSGRIVTWSWRFCNGGLPGHLSEPCGHWHHQYELFMALG